MHNFSAKHDCTKVADCMKVCYVPVVLAFYAHSGKGISPYEKELQFKFRLMEIHWCLSVWLMEINNAILSFTKKAIATKYSVALSERKAEDTEKVM